MKILPLLEPKFKKLFKIGMNLQHESGKPGIISLYVNIGNNDASLKSSCQKKKNKKKEREFYICPCFSIGSRRAISEQTRNQLHSVTHI